MPNPPDLATATHELELALVAFRKAVLTAPAPGPGARPAVGPLFHALRTWRTEQARARQLPPYVIATDAVLRAIEEARPVDLAALQTIRGVGPAKIATYGEDILRVVAQATAA